VAKSKAHAKPAAKKPARKAAPKAKPTPRKKSKARKPARPGVMGRPSGYTPAIAAAVCGWIKQGYTLRQVGALPNMPDKATICRWLGDHEDFCDQYVRAGEIRALLMGDEMIEIADDSTNDWIAREGKDGAVEIVVDQEAIARSRVRVEARKWLMVKLAPKRFGATLAVTGKDGGPVQHVHQTVGEVLDEIDGAGTGLPNHGADHSSK
jgi:hypothetical protein